MPSSIGKGGVSARFRIASDDARTSIAPVGQVRVDGVRVAGDDVPRHVDDELAPELLGEGEDAGVREEPRVEDDLGEARPVAEVDEDELAVVAAAVDPAHEAHGLSGVLGPKGPGGGA